MSTIIISIDFPLHDTTGTLSIMPPFFGNGKRLGIAGGKEGFLYVLNLDNLGGYSNGAGATDGVVQKIWCGGMVFSTATSFPGGGGYLYLAPEQQPLMAFQYTLLGGNSFFQLAGTTRNQPTNVQANMSYAYGQMATQITSIQDDPNSAIAWVRTRLSCHPISYHIISLPYHLISLLEHDT
jgi:hypothetical protein